MKKKPDKKIKKEIKSIPRKFNPGTMNYEVDVSKLKKIALWFKKRKDSSKNKK